MRNDILINGIDILFRKVNSQQIINNTFEVLTGKGFKNKYIFNNTIKSQFINEGFAIFKERSEDEIENIYMYVNEKINEKTGVFNLINQLSHEFLCIEGQDILCRKEHLLDWRMIYSRIGQDIVTTSASAIYDIENGREKKEFNWKPIIDIEGIQNTEDSVAENHFHLKGSAPTFTLNWISLMNDITGRTKQFEKANIDAKRLNPDLNFSTYKRNSSIYILLKKAAIIRAFLFSWINDKSFFSNGGKWQEQKEWEELNEYLQNDMLLDLKSYAVQEKINTLKFKFGKLFNEKRIIDYAIKKSFSESNLINLNDVLSGERYILYMMFKKIYDKNEENDPYINIFYAYITIKLKFRSELIQVNKRVGFKNFSDYQDRKSCFIKHDKLLMSLLHNTAINHTLENQTQIKWLEARIAPKITKGELHKTICKIDNDVKRYRSREDSKLDILNQLESKYKMYNLDKYFYVIHFIKGKDKSNYNNNKNKLYYSFLPRDYRKRNEVKKQALSFEALREDYYFMKKNNSVLQKNRNVYHPAKRILGIDGCANEIGCRPEVFAQAFRYLRKIKNTDVNLDKMILGATYHVGEDFLDIVDGLRAIDEAIKYLCLRKNDRLGHALALGIDVEKWYKYKNRIIVISKQDLLDNIAWLLNKCQSFTSDMFNESFKENDFNKIKKELEEYFNKYFEEIYGENLIYNNIKYTEFTCKDYFNSWLLRGNNPYSYIKNSRNNKKMGSWKDYEFVKYDLIDKDEKKAECLFYNYHFNIKSKKSGKEMEAYSISEEYEKLVQIVQNNMISEVQNKEIFIETNPSSNYSIGTIQRYDEHPILRFYNVTKNDTNCLVSINTDDQGIFNTNLTNEYAIMEVALERKYSSDDIKNWIENIKKASLEQSFAYLYNND
ncbi:hypothetical protein FDA09_09190 [Clostridium botulinum]|uniref:hypothetical protein n=1 Tax=Clostridium botulinum TaxID=1491 RepID=UPI000773B51D|nr:hypothetical protein [Clostridium botulinum]MBN1058782.1 hypothetical protein [Clostridium botulinum]MBN1061952.1 hypothetical protein [Clostridium botulinum]NFH80547.1 hypothetical protein [Clostridium botulinum]NFH83516.1 hypothetical protein [Clostridium botulinum]NFI11561.1 hypothetical protein [Clostridium botulinum]